MKVFEDVVQAAEAAAVCREAVNRFCREQRELDEAIRSRIRRSREECGRELAYHKAVLADPAATVTQKRIGALEVERLESQTFTASAEEVLEFRRATEAALVAIEDYERVRQTFREALKVASDALKDLKEQVLPTMELKGRERDSVNQSADTFERFTCCGNFT